MTYQGGAFEFVAAYNKLGYPNYQAQGQEMTDEAKDNQNNYISTRYITAYENNENTSVGNIIYTVGKTGDATKECNGIFSKVGDEGFVSWFKDRMEVVKYYKLFIRRGGNAFLKSKSGLFYSDCWDGGTDSERTFRVVLVP